MVVGVQCAGLGLKTADLPRHSYNRVKRKWFEKEKRSDEWPFLVQKADSQSKPEA